MFDTYEEASIAAEKANNNKRKSIICKVSEYDSLLKKHNKDLAICQQFEQLVHEKTKEMIITKEDISVKKLIRKKSNNN